MKMSRHSKEQNLSKFDAYFDSLLEGIDSQVVVVMDGDETLSTRDTSQIFWENNFDKKAWLDFREDFVKLGRNFEGYLQAAHRYSLIDEEDYVRHCKDTSRLVELRRGWNDFVKVLPVAILVTSGIRLLWDNVIRTNNWTNVRVVGGNHLALDNFIVDPDIKHRIIKKLKSAGKQVIVFGDSRVDAPMLKSADLGVVVANERKSPNLVDSLQGAKNVYQIQMEEEVLPGLPLFSFDEIVNNYFKQNI